MLNSMLNDEPKMRVYNGKDLDLCYQITTPIDDNRKNGRNLV